MVRRTRTVELSRLGGTAARGGLSDAAVDGLIGGVVAGIAMAACLVVAGLLAGMSPDVTLAGFDPGRGASPLVGLLLHLALAAVYGVCFGIGWWLLRRRGFPAVARPDGEARRTATAGVIYGLGLLAVAQWIWTRGPSPPILEMPFAPLAMAHIVYGLVLGYLVGRAGRRSVSRREVAR